MRLNHLWLTNEPHSVYSSPISPLTGLTRRAQMELKHKPEFVEGKWYAVGWKMDDGQIRWDQIIKYEGDDCWSDEDGEVESLYDPILQTRVAVDAADAYARQG